MKHKLALLLTALLFVTGFLPATSAAARVFIEIGDRPYYIHGPVYWYQGYRWYWVPGHWGWRDHYQVWIHGYYARRY